MLSRRFTRRFSETAAIVLIVTVGSACSGRNGVIAEYMERSVALEGKEYRFRVRLPKNRRQDGKVPAMLFLHGSGARGDDNIAQVDSFRWAIEPSKDDLDFIAVLPQCRHDTFWSSVEMTSYALAALDASVAEFNGDRDRLYLSGWSLGGYGTWQIAAAYPNRFAALVPIAGGVVGQQPIDPRDRAAIIPAVGEMLDSAEPYKAVALALRNTPVWVFHGAADDAVPVDFSRRIVSELGSAGNMKVRYTEYPTDGHMIIIRAFSEPGLFDWLSEQRRFDQDAAP